MSKNKHGNNPQPAQNNPAQPPAGEVSTSERSVIGAAIVQSIICEAELKTQDERINAFEATGWRHYESIPIVGNMILLRFRKVA